MEFEKKMVFKQIGLLKVVTAAVEAREPEDEDATLYLIIGTFLLILQTSLILLLYSSYTPLIIFLYSSLYKHINNFRMLSRCFGNYTDIRVLCCNHY